MKKTFRPKLIDVLTLGASLAFFYAAWGLGFYFVWAKLGSSMENMWAWKRVWYLRWMIGSLLVALPCWVLVLSKRVGRRSK